MQSHPLVFASMMHVTTSYNKIQSKPLQNERRKNSMRRPAVTRTVNILNITVLCMDTVSCETMTLTLPVYESEAPKDEAKLFNYMRKMYETDTFKITAITEKTALTKTYTMPLSKYIEVAEEVKTEKADTAQ